MVNCKLTLSQRKQQPEQGQQAEGVAKNGGKNQKKKNPKPHQPLQNWDSLPNMRILSHKEETDVHGWNLHVALFSSRIQ